MHKYISYEERLQIEVLYNTKHSKKYIAGVLNRHISTIYREIEKGLYSHTLTDLREELRYSAQKAQKYADYQATAKGRDLKIGNDYALVGFVEDCILNKGWSPDQIVGFIKVNNLPLTSVCRATLYNYIYRGLFFKVSPKNLYCKGQRKKTNHKSLKVRKRACLGLSIEKRPFAPSERLFGNWEMDTVIGQRSSKNALLVLTERYTRYELIYRIKSKTAAEVIKCLNHLEWKYGKSFKDIFKTITVDNGSEFSSYELMKKSYRSKSARTEIYYCHPYSSWERGSNERQNQIIRRYIKKGIPIEKYDDNYIRIVESSINKMPRKMFDYRSSEDLFSEQLKLLRT